MSDKLRSHYVFLLAILYLLSCENGTSVMEPAPLGAFDYQAFDSTGTLVVTGWLSFNFIDSTEIEGAWNFDKIGNPSNIGPQIGEGQLKGSLFDNTININLNPNFADNNVFLNGTLNDNIFEGDWSWSTFVGETNRGTFQAKRE